MKRRDGIGTSSKVLYLIEDPVSPKSKDDVTERLSRAYDAEPIGVWSLEYRLFRSTVKSQDERDSKLKHILQLKFEHGRCSDQAYMWYSDASIVPADTPVSNGTERRASVIGREQLEKAEERENVLVIASAQLPEYSHWLNSKMTASWAPRAALHVTGGSTYAIEDESVIVRIGELRHRGSTGQHQNVKGIIVALDAMEGQSGNDEIAVEDQTEAPNAENESGPKRLANIWKNFGGDGAKQYHPAAKASLSENDVIRMYCELLSQKG